MEEAFKPLSLSIRELFGNQDALYKIPLYQRPYKWEDEQIEKLWDDVDDAYQNEDGNYFLGSIITAKPRDNEKSAYIDVVDGQQRLTTLMILFCVIRDLYPDINKLKSDEDPYAVDLDTITNSISLYGKSKRLKLFTHMQHQTDFEKIILNGDTTKLKKPYKYQIRIDEEPKYKFINTAIIFRDRLIELGQVYAEPLINFLFNYVKIIRIDCKNKEFAIKLFQVLNDRGMDLSAADLIKSYLIEQLYKKYKDDAETAKMKVEQFIADWQEIEYIMKGSENINLNDLFIIYEYYLLGQNPKKSLYDELQKAFKGKDPNELIGDIKNFANTYHTNIVEGEDPILFSFWYIRWTMYWKTILLTALHTNYADYNKLLKELQRFYYLYWMAGKTLSQIKQTSFNLIRSIKDKKPILEISKELNDKLNSDKIIELATRNLTNEHITSYGWCKPLLILMEYNATDRSKLSFIALDNELHLEHILPQKYTKFTEWEDITDEVATQWVNSSGNITLLCGKKNIEASNNPFHIKMDVYTGKGKYEDKNDKITAFSITQSIVRDFQNKKYDGQWTLESMRDRKKWFLKEVEEMFDIEIVETTVSSV